MAIRVLRLVAGCVLAPSLAVPALADDCRAEYKRKIDHLENQLANKRVANSLTVKSGGAAAMQPLRSTH